MSASASGAAAFLLKEARLLDEQRFSEWLELLAEDFRYWVPVSPDADNPEASLSHFLDDRHLAEARIHRLQNPRPYSPEPPARCCRLVTNIEIVDETPTTAETRSNLLLVEWTDRSRLDDNQRVFAGCVRHSLIRADDSYLIQQKRVDLVSSLDSFNAMSVPF